MMLLKQQFQWRNTAVSKIASRTSK